MNSAILMAITGIVLSAHDGDTLTTTNGTRIRLAGIDANELNGTCHNECAPLSAIASRDQLARLVQGREIVCQPTGTSYRRVVAWCSVGGVDLSCWQVRTGGAVRWAKYDRAGRLLGCGQGQGRGH